MTEDGMVSGRAVEEGRLSSTGACLAGQWRRAGFPVKGIESSWMSKWMKTALPLASHWMQKLIPGRLQIYM